MKEIFRRDTPHGLLVVSIGRSGKLVASGVGDEPKSIPGPHGLTWPAIWICPLLIGVSQEEFALVTEARSLFMQREELSGLLGRSFKSLENCTDLWDHDACLPALAALESFDAAHPEIVESLRAVGGIE